MRSVLSLAFLFLTVNCFSQVKYSPADLAQIQKNRTQEKKAYKTWDRQLHYEVGAFFDTIYHKYRDTSMSAAIRNYTKSTESEGDLMDPGSLLAAFRLGQVYESGIGADTNIPKAMFYYLLSHDAGNVALEKLKEGSCSGPRIIHQSPDSLVIAFSPFCITDPQTFSFLRPFAEKIRGDNGKQISASIRYPLSGIKNAYYSYYNTQVVPQRAVAVIGEYLLPLISLDRLSNFIESNSYNGDEHRMTFVLRNPTN